MAAGMYPERQARPAKVHASNVDWLDINASYDLVNTLYPVKQMTANAVDSRDRERARKKRRNRNI